MALWDDLPGRVVTDPRRRTILCFSASAQLGLDPGLVIVAALQVAKPVVLFVGGAWCAVYLTNRQTERAELKSASLAGLLRHSTSLLG